MHQVSPNRQTGSGIPPVSSWLTPTTLGAAVLAGLTAAAMLVYREPSALSWLGSAVVGATWTVLVYIAGRRAEAQANATHAEHFLTQQAEAEARFAEASEAAEAAVAEIERTSRAKSAFFASVSGGLRSELTAIAGYAEMLAEEAREEGHDHLAPDLAKVRAASERVLAVVDDALDFARLDAAQARPEFNPVDVGQLLDVVVAAATPWVERRGSRLVVQRPALGVFTTDPARLQQILLHLLSFAARRTQNGTVVLAVRRTPDRGLVALVRDTGAGITEARAEELFHPFARPGTAALRTYGETGLEIAVSLRAARLLGGSLTVESQLDGGATFTLTLPDRTADAPQSAPRMDTYFPVT